MISDRQSVCIYHNGNSRVLKYYQDKFSHLKFSGNWAEAQDRPGHGCLWEICFADATTENMMAAVDCGIFVLRHISSYQDDIENLLPECEKFDYQHWLNYVVSNNLCFSDQVVSDITLADPLTDTYTVAVITTGRTANAHFRHILKSQGHASFEANSEENNVISSRLLQSNSAVFLWRIDQWECLTSHWIGFQSEYIHQLIDQPVPTFNTVPSISLNWINNNWYNHCRNTLSHAMFFQYVCQRPITYTTTEHVVANLQSQHQKIKYDKSSLIVDYQQSKQYYEKSNVFKNLNRLHTRVAKHFDSWQRLC